MLTNALMHKSAVANRVVTVRVEPERRTLLLLLLLLSSLMRGLRGAAGVRVVLWLIEIEQVVVVVRRLC